MGAANSFHLRDATAVDSSKQRNIVFSESNNQILKTVVTHFKYTNEQDKTWKNFFWWLRVVIKDHMCK